MSCQLILVMASLFSIYHFPMLIGQCDRNTLQHPTCWIRSRIKSETSNDNCEMKIANSTLEVQHFGTRGNR